MFFFGKKPAHSITILPHAAICPSGDIVPASTGKSIAETLVAKGVEISHSCQYQCACTTCHVYVMEGGEFLTPMDAEEDRMLATTQNRQRWSRLSCQAVYNGKGDVVIDICE
ncbi:MAG: ISC system 2Fe-2S type ferredoxin [Nitrosomonadales bacterium]|jgi:2Fe-2S ferredoxin|nr:MAG: ISC system 2Fe-2S type ferredoxin [Nitrosomonadales bacterium]